jgi:hypothetical protein
MMHNLALVAIGNARQLLVPLSNRTKALVGASARQRNVPLLPELLCSLHTLAVQANGFGVFRFVKHWHSLPAAPAPEHLHLHSILAQLHRRLFVIGEQHLMI